MRTGAVTHALNAQLSQFRKRGNAGAGKDVDGRAMDVIDQRADMVRVAQAGNENTIATGFEVSGGAVKGAAQRLVRSYTALPIGINAGVDDEVDVELVCGAARGLDTLDLLRQWKERAEMFVSRERIFKIYTNGARVDDLRDGGFKLLCARGKAGFDIGSDRNADAASDAPDKSKHVIPGNLLAVGIAERVGAGRAAGGDSGQSAMLNHGGAGGVPGVDEDQRRSGMVKLKKSSGFLCLRHFMVISSHAGGRKSAWEIMPACRWQKNPEANFQNHLLLGLFCVFKT